MISIDIDNLKVGQTIKDYKTLCEALCIKPATGKSKQIQMEKISQYIKYKKLGRGYYIEEILDQPDHIMSSKSKSPYIKLIETLLSAHLIGNKESTSSYTYKQLFQILSMASDKYDGIYKDDSYEYFYNNIAPISKDLYLDFRRSTYSENKKKIKSALNSLKRRALIDYREDLFVCCEDNEGHDIHREPTNQEILIHLEICQQLLNKYNCRDFDELAEKRVKHKFENDYSNEIKKRLGWKYKYKKVTIISAINDPTKLLEDSKQELILEARKHKVEVNKAELNYAIKKMINRVGEVNHNSAVQKLEEWERGDEEWGTIAPQMPNTLYSILYRTKENYLPGWNILTEYYIGGDEEAAKDRARDYQIDELDKESDDLNLEI